MKAAVTKKTLLKSLSVACIAAMGLSSIAEAAGTKLLIWHAYRGEEKAAFDQVIAAFNAKNKDAGLEARALAVPYDAYADKITASVPRGRGPDVFIFAQDRLGGWIEAGNTVESIDFYLTDEIKSRFIPATLESMTYHDTVYGLPLNYKNITMIYNKKLVKEPPKTTSELVKVAKSLTNKESGSYGLAYEYSNFYFHAALMNAFGGKVFEPGPKPVLASDANVKSLEYVMKWYKEDGILPTEPSSGLITTLFNSGKAAIIFSGPWTLGEISKDIDYGLAVLPTVDEAGGKPMQPWMTVEGVYISKPSNLKDQAFQFVDFSTSTDAGKMMAVTGRQTPANKLVYDLPEIAADKQLSAFRNQVENAVAMPNLAEMTAVWSPATTAMNMVVKGAATPKDAMGIAQATIQRAVDALRNKK